VKHVGYLLREGLGDIEAVAANVEEGAAVAEAVLEAREIVADAVEGAEPLDEAGTSLRSSPCVAPRWAPTVVVFW
jgi:hypothetical protein